MNFSKLILFDFPKLWNTIGIWIWSTKTFEKLLKVRILSLKTLIENLAKTHLYRPKQKLVIRLKLRPDWPCRQLGSWSLNDYIFSLRGLPVDRSIDRAKIKNFAGSVGRLIDLPNSTAVDLSIRPSSDTLGLYTSVHVGRPCGRPAEQMSSVIDRSCGRPASAQKQYIEYFKTSF